MPAQVPSFIRAFLFQRETTTPHRGTRGSNPGSSRSGSGELSAECGRRRAAGARQGWQRGTACPMTSIPSASPLLEWGDYPTGRCRSPNQADAARFCRPDAGHSPPRSIKRSAAMLGFVRLAAGRKRIRTRSPAMRSYRQQRGPGRAAWCGTARVSVSTPSFRSMPRTSASVRGVSGVIVYSIGLFSSLSPRIQ